MVSFMLYVFNHNFKIGEWWGEERNARHYLHQLSGLCAPEVPGLRAASLF